MTSDRRRNGKAASRRRTDALSHESNKRAVGHVGVPRVNGPLSQDARCRQFAEGRLDSARDYGKFATAAGVDLLNGEPLKTLMGVNRLDETSLRFKQHELRERMLEIHLQDTPKKLTAVGKD